MISSYTHSLRAVSLDCSRSGLLFIGRELIREEASASRLSPGSLGRVAKPDPLGYSYIQGQRDEVTCIPCCGEFESNLYK